MTMTTEDEPIETIVARVWREELRLPTMSVAEEVEFLAGETERISDRIEELVPDTMQIQADYRRQTGRRPDYLTTVSLINTARAQARAIVLDEELYSQIPGRDEAFEPESTIEEAQQAQATADARRRAVHRNDPDRWMNPLHCSEPSQQNEDLADRLWADRTVWFRVVASRLLQVRQEDSMAMPQEPTGAVFQSCTSLVEAQLIAQGRVRDAHGPR